MIKLEVNKLVGKKFTASVIKQAILKTAQAFKIKNASLSVAFVGDKTMRQLNRKWRGKNKITDVLSFGPVKGFALEGRKETKDFGEIIINFATAKRQARARGASLKKEIALLAIHGFLHCLGYDHETIAQEKKMFALQDKILKNVKP